MMRIPLGLTMSLGATVFTEITVALGRTAPVDHHLSILLFGHAGHTTSHLLETLTIRSANLGQKIDIPASMNALVEITSQHCLFLFLSHWPFIQVGSLIRLEAFPVRCPHQRHAELVEMVTLASLLCIENDSSRNIEIRFVECHFPL